MHRQTFQARFREAATAARDFARSYVAENLPDALLFRVRLNSSYDGITLLPDQRVYPEDSSFERAQALSECSEAQAVETLYRDGMTPGWVNLSVIGETGEATLIEVVACGRFTANDSLLYHQGEGRPPFHVLGPTLPPGYRSASPFSIYHRSECWTAKEVLRVAQHGSKVWTLELVGDEFDDAALLDLPPLPALEILELRHSPLCGPGLSRLDRFRKLRVLRIELAGERAFSVQPMATLPKLETLALSGLPGWPWNLDVLESRTPALASLSLKAFGDLALRGACPNVLERLTLAARRLTGALRLPQRLPHFGLHLKEASPGEIEELLAPVGELTALDLRGTPVDEALVQKLLARFPLEYLDLVDTGLPDDAVRKIGAEHSGMRLWPNLG